MDFAVGLTSVKIKSVNLVFSLFYSVTVASIRENFICEFSFLEPSAKILSHENFSLYGIYTKHCIVQQDYLEV